MRHSLTAAAGLTAALFAFAGPPGTPAPRTLDEQDADYFEDALAPRPIAAVHAALRTDGARRWVELEVAASGPHVEPLPGLEGAPGHNLRTAEELHELLDVQDIAFALRDDGASVPGTLLAVRRATQPARRLRADGTLDETRTAARLPVAVSFRSPDLPAAADLARTYLIVRGLPRLLVEIDLDADRIGRIDSLGEPQAEDAR